MEIDWKYILNQFLVGPQGYTLVNVMPGQHIERTLEQIGWIPANSYLIVLNNGITVGNYKVELFEA